MHEDVESLLALQRDDAAIRALEKRKSALEPKLMELDRRRQAASDAVTRTRAAIETEERKHRELQLRISEHKQLHERNVAQLDVVRRMRDATAAVAQVEQARKILADEESELQTMSRRLAEMRQSVDTQQLALEELEESQAEERARIATDRLAIEEELRHASQKRDGAAARVERPLLAKYDRIRIRRKGDAVFPLRGPSCGNCDTAIPLQRRNVMVTSKTIEVCEGCGVLLYASE